MPYDWPSLIIGLLMAAYWYRVVRKAVHVKKRTGRAGGIVPTEPLGRFLRVIWYPVVVIWIVYPIVHAFLAAPPAGLRPLYHLPVLAWTTVGIAVIAFIATLVCWKRMGRSWRMGIDPAEKTNLVTRGPYAYVRHPIYALSILLMLCTMAILPTPLMLTAGVIHIAFIVWESRREEQHLVTQHGERYVQYCAKVRRFIPTLTPQH
jgi:protein-S-isoprenylcysteine O-methyltransferase Ste14